MAGAPYSDSNGDSGNDQDAGTPGWVKVFGIIALVVVVLFAVTMFMRGPGGHGPARHMSAPERGVQQP
jgi:hypothetical protein